MKVFITGATGFIGMHLCKMLVNKNHEVTALLRTESKQHLLPTNVEIIKGDLSIFEDQDFVLPIFDIVIHLAGVIFAKDEAAYMKYNYEAVQHLIQCIERQSWNLKRFIFASSLAAAGPSGEKRILTELDTPNPVEAYGGAKLKAEQYLATITSFPITSFRPAIVLGAGDTNSLTLFKLAQKRFGMSVNGKPQFLSFVDIDDLNDGIHKMMLDTSKENKTYFVAHPDRISNVALFRNLGKVLDRKVFVMPMPKPILYIVMKLSTFFSNLFGLTNQLDEKQYNQLINHFVCSGAALTKDLDWQPQHNLYDTIKRAYDGYKELEML